MLRDMFMLYLGSTPHAVTVANEGLVRDSLLKRVHNPGGDWHPGWGVDLSYTVLPNIDPSSCDSEIQVVHGNAEGK